MDLVVVLTTPQSWVLTGLNAAIEMEFMVRLVARYNVEGSGFGSLSLNLPHLEMPAT